MSGFVNRTVLAVALCIGAAGGSVAVGQSGAQQRVTPGEVKWPAGAASLVGTSGVSGIQTVVLKGDPTKPGLYALLLRVGSEHEDRSARASRRSRRDGGHRHLVLRVRTRIR